ncbi:hypothetical protein [Schlesneria sp. DSM 10557]|uniref:hypothetical protein n=1 Tax=Schlesneria sp. DSM 10557 TaxID=3044399 RepID=UPI0035A16B53
MGRSPLPPPKLFAEAAKRAVSNRPPKEWQLVWHSSAGDLASGLMTHQDAQDQRRKLVNEMKCDSLTLSLSVELNVDQANFESELDRTRARRLSNTA